MLRKGIGNVKMKMERKKIGYAKIVAKGQVIGCMDQKCFKDILERT